jgi:hypothetical protein
VRFSTTHVAAEPDAGLFAFERNDGGHRIVVVINTSDANTSTAPVPTGFVQGTGLTDVLALDGTMQAVTVGPAGALTVTLPPRSARIYVPNPDVVALP